LIRFVSRKRVDVHGRGKRLVVQFMRHDPVSTDVDEEVLPLVQSRVYLAPGMHDEADRRLHLTQVEKPIRALFQ